MKKGFATSAILYTILLLFLVLMVGILNNLQNKKSILDGLKADTVNALEKDTVLDGILNQIAIINSKINQFETQIGTTDISNIGDGTITGAISHLNNNLFPSLKNQRCILWDTVQGTGVNEYSCISFQLLTSSENTDIYLINGHMRVAKSGEYSFSKGGLAKYSEIISSNVVVTPSNILNHDSTSRINAFTYMRGSYHEDGTLDITGWYANMTGDQTAQIEFTGFVVVGKK